MVDQLCDAQRTTGVASGGLNPEILEGPLAKQTPVADAVESDTAGETKILVRRPRKDSS